MTSSIDLDHDKISFNKVETILDKQKISKFHDENLNVILVNI